MEKSNGRKEVSEIKSKGLPISNFQQIPLISRA